MAPDFWIVATAIALPFVGAALTPFLYRVIGEAVGYVGAILAVISFGLVATLIGTSGDVSQPWIPSMEVAFRFRVDGLAVLFALLASGIGVLIFTYSTGYMHGKPDLGRFYMTLLAFMGSILGIAFSADLVLLFLFWELTSVCSFVLIGYHTDDEESRYSARMAMIVTVGGGLCLLLAVLLLGIVAGVAGGGPFNLAAMLSEPEAVKAALEENGLFRPVLGLLTIAAAAKSAQVPLYFWLPRAMVAPTPVSAFLHSATMVKVGVYALGRFRPILEGPEWMIVIATLGLVTMTVGAVLAILADDIKELLAYSTASHLGLMVAGFGFLTHYGPEAGTFHLLNHAVFKAALFLVAGIIAHQVGTRKIDSLSGLRHELPITAGITAITALSMAGIPPLNGFYSKEILFEAAWVTAEGYGGLAWLFPITAVVASIGTVLYSLRFLWLFLGDPPDDAGSISRPSLAMLAPAALLAVVAASISVVPDAAVGLVVEDAAIAAATEPIDMHAGLPTHVSGPVLMSAVTILLGVGLFPMYAELQALFGTVHRRTRQLHPTTVYDQTLDIVDDASGYTSRVVQNGLIRTYASWLLLGASVVTLLGFVVAGVANPTPTIGETPAAMSLVLGVAIVAAVAIATTDSQTTGVLTLGILGFMVAIFYILASGPDLALTQLVVETLVLLVFLLVLEQMPTFYGEIERETAIRDATISLVVGSTAFVAVLVAMPTGDAPLSPTAAYYVENAVPKGGGANIVNVILTDFRAFDTLGEVTVILVAALSVFVLLAMRSKGETL